MCGSGDSAIWEMGGAGQNPIFLHHCEGAPGPVPGGIIAAQKSQAILGGSGTSLPLKIITRMIIITVCIELSLIPTNLLSPDPGFLLSPTTGLCKCWWAMGSSVHFWGSSDASPWEYP